MDGSAWTVHFFWLQWNKIGHFTRSGLTHAGHTARPRMVCPGCNKNQSTSPRWSVRCLHAVWLDDVNDQLVLAGKWYRQYRLNVTSHREWVGCVHNDHCARQNITATSAALHVFPVNRKDLCPMGVTSSLRAGWLDAQILKAWLLPAVLFYLVFYFLRLFHFCVPFDQFSLFIVVLSFRIF